MDREVMHLRDSLVPRYAEMIYNGYWFAPEREVLQKMMDEAQSTVSGTARLKLFKGNCIVIGKEIRRIPLLPDFATFEEDAGLQPEGCRRVHPSERPASADPALCWKKDKRMILSGSARGGSRTAPLLSKRPGAGRIPNCTHAHHPSILDNAKSHPFVDLLFLLVFSGDAGRKGRPWPRKYNFPAPVSDLRAWPREGAVFLGWSIPTQKR